MQIANRSPLCEARGESDAVALSLVAQHLRRSPLSTLQVPGPGSPTGAKTEYQALKACSRGIARTCGHGGGAIPPGPMQKSLRSLHPVPWRPRDFGSAPTWYIYWRNYL